MESPSWKEVEENAGKMFVWKMWKYISYNLLEEKKLASVMRMLWSQTSSQSIGN